VLQSKLALHYLLPWLIRQGPPRSPYHFQANAAARIFLYGRFGLRTSRFRCVPSLLFYHRLAACSCRFCGLFSGSFSGSTRGRANREQQGRVRGRQRQLDTTPPRIGAGSSPSMVGAGAVLLGVDAGARAAIGVCARREVATAVVAVARRSLSGTTTRSNGHDRRTPRGASTLGWSGTGTKAPGSRNSSTTSSSTSALVFTSPPEELEDGFFERPTPLLLVAGEGQPSTW